MFRSVFTFIALLCWMPVTVAMAEDAPAPTDPNYVRNSPCWTARKPDDFDAVSACFNAALEAADAELNQVYKAHLDSVDPQWPLAEDYINVFRSAQRAWIAFRDADCERISLVVRDEANLWLISCREYHTRKRILELQAY